MSKKWKNLRLKLLGLFLLLLDQVAKILATKFNLAKFNPGISFNLFALRPYLLSIVLILFFVILLIVFRRIKGAEVFKILILIGALSNLLDRFIYAGVVDYLPLGPRLYNNLADYYLFIGIIGISICNLKLFSRIKTSWC